VLADLVSRTLAFATAHRIDMLTLQPWYEMRGLWERIVLPAGLAPLLVVFPPGVVNDPKSSLSMANGQFILIRREVYDAIDGHAGIKDQMMDDYSLAQNVKGSGYRLFIADGSEVMRVRLYTNLREIWGGALKAAVQISGGWLMSILGLVGNIMLTLLPPVIFTWAVISGNQAGMISMGLVLGVQLGYHVLIRMAGFRLPPWSAVSYPLGGLIVTAILLDGMIRLSFGGDIKWKGRDLLGRPDLQINR